ncbi:unnamed protein product [Dicrocoelium dendriticum]|nr:unnamed protein product [Dicrocoelium dendriticum]
MDQVENTRPPSALSSTPRLHCDSNSSNRTSDGMDSPRNTPELREECTTDTSLTDEPGMLGPRVEDTFAELPPAKGSPTVDEHFRQESTAPRSTDDGSAGPSSRSSCSEAPRIQALRNQLRLLSEKLRPRLTPCCHLTASELCYVCHQRRARNVSVNLKDEAQRREQAEEQILLEYQQLRAENEAKREKEYADTKKQRLEAQAAYNLAVIDEHKCRDVQENGKSSSFDMLLHRPCTPLKGTGQDALRAELDKQTEWKRVRQKKEADDRMYQERNEQKRLVDQLANDKLMEHKQKLEKQKKYKEALDVQVDRTVGKGLQLPLPEPPSNAY